MAYTLLEFKGTISQEGMATFPQVYRIKQNKKALFQYGNKDGLFIPLENL